MNDPNSGVDAVNHLQGAKLDGDWTVLEKIQKPENGTGGHFSVCYQVEHKSGKRAFLKALNLGKALNMPGDTLRQIESLIKTFNFERETLELCRAKKMRRIATPLADGKLQPLGSAYPVYYIIFDLADGDIRKKFSNFASIDLAWVLRTLHQTAAALGELHTDGIAHQDLKPSNVLVYGSRETKVSDLGCAHTRTNGSPRGHLHVAGDKSYAPPELLYHEIALDREWERRRLGCDLYLFGSMVVFLFTGTSINSVIFSKLGQPHRPGFWPQDYRTVLPFVRDAFGKAIREIATGIPEAVRPEIISVVEELCDPEPEHRGDLGNPSGNQFSVERYVSLFNRLAARAEFGLFE